MTRQNKPIRLVRTWFVRLGELIFKQRRDLELAAEMESHIQMHIEDGIQSGLAPNEARRRAMIALGGVEQAQENYRDRRGWPLLETLIQDVSFGLRMLRKNPGFTAMAVLTLGLGIGANTAIFSVIDSALLNPIPFPQPNRIVDIYASWPQFPKATLSYPNFLDLQRGNHSFQQVADWRFDRFTLTGSGEPERLAGEMASADYLGVLGVRPVLGRSFRTDDDQLGAAPVAMLGEGLWKRRIGSDRNIVGKSVVLNGKSYTVIGVVPSSVRLLHFQDSYFDDVFVPLGQWDNPMLRDRRFSLGLRTIGRLKTGVALVQARAEMRQFQGNLSAAYPNVNAGLIMGVDGLKDDQIGDTQPTLLMLWGAVRVVLLIACANVANLLLARATGRNQEFAVRTALGASRRRIVRQLLIESVLLVAFGGTIGIFLAEWGTRSVLSILPAALPATSRVEINSSVLLFAAVVSLLAGVMFGLIPALRLSKAEVQENLREGHHRTAGSNHGVQGWFVAIEIGLALVLLVGAGLLIRSLENVWALNPGFDPENVLTCDVSFSMGRMATTEKAVAVVGELKDEVASLPGAKSVAIVLGGLPFELNSEVPVWPDEKPKPEKLSAWPLAVSYVVGPDYFKTMRIPLLRGRAFTQEDNASAPSVVIIDDDLAKSMFVGDPIGKKVDFGAGTRPAQVVGVVGHVAQSDRFEKGKPVVDFQTYSPSLQAYAVLSPLAGNAATILVRTTGSLESLVGPIRQVVHSLDANAVVYDVRTMHQVIAASLAERRFSMVLLGIFAGIALALAAIGIYGVASYLVGQRTHEIGVRMALGAQPRDILRDVLGEGGKMAAAGIALGLAASLGLTRLMTSMLFGVSATDPLTLAAVVAVLLAVALLACWIPARRAIHIDPMVALRHE